MSQCEWILYESGQSFLMKASRILYQTVPDSLQCSCCCLKRAKMIIIEIFSLILLEKCVSSLFYAQNMHLACF